MECIRNCLCRQSNSFEISVLPTAGAGACPDRLQVLDDALRASRPVPACASPARSPASRATSRAPPWAASPAASPPPSAWIAPRPAADTPWAPSSPTSPAARMRDLPPMNVDFASSRPGGRPRRPQGAEGAVRARPAGADRVSVCPPVRVSSSATPVSSARAPVPSAGIEFRGAQCLYRSIRSGRPSVRQQQRSGLAAWRERPEGEPELWAKTVRCDPIGSASA